MYVKKGDFTRTIVYGILYAVFLVLLFCDGLLTYMLLFSPYYLSIFFGVLFFYNLDVYLFAKKEKNAAIVLIPIATFMFFFCIIGMYFPIWAFSPHKVYVLDMFFNIWSVIYGFIYGVVPPLIGTVAYLVLKNVPIEKIESISPHFDALREENTEKPKKLYEISPNERCPSCKYEFTSSVIFEKGDKTATISCPNCHHIFKKRITKKMLKEAERL